MEEQRNHFWEVAADTKGSEWAYVGGIFTLL